MYPSEIRLFYQVLFGVAILLFITGMFTLYAIAIKKKLMAVLDEKMRIYISQLDNERERIASDLHDQIGASVSNVKLHLQCINDLHGQNKNLQEKAIYLIDDVMTDIRKISFDLMPITLERNGILPALHELIDSMKDNTGILINFENKILNIDDYLSIPVFRICQELLHNAIKHSQASEIEVCLKQNEDALMMVFNDNGKGFDVKNVEQNNRGTGIHNICSRVRLLSGTVSITSAETGTKYKILIPRLKQST